MGWAAAAMRRAWYGLNPEIRKSRAHTQKGDFVLGTPRQAFDCVMVVATGAARKLAGVRPAWPWITFPAMRFVRRRLKGGLRVFEWGCGMSTVWFERRGWCQKCLPRGIRGASCLQREIRVLPRRLAQTER